jgi:hypothetical protein
MYSCFVKRLITSIVLINSTTKFILLQMFKSFMQLTIIKVLIIGETYYFCLTKYLLNG